MHEEQRERLRVLSDSINETARMARATNSLFLFVALYLALTLLSNTDENLLRNGQVVLPQVGVARESGPCARCPTSYTARLFDW